MIAKSYYLQVKTLLSFVRQDFSEDDLRNSLEAARMTPDSDCRESDGG